MLDNREILITLAIKRSYDKSKFPRETLHIDSKNIISILKACIPFEEEYKEVTPQYIGRILKRLEDTEFLGLNSMTRPHHTYLLVKEYWDKGSGEEIIEDICKKWKK